MATVVQAMQRPDSGLEIRDRMWLKITIPNAFIGTDMIEWLLNHVEGFQVGVFRYFLEICSICNHLKTNKLHFAFDAYVYCFW